jgi:type IV secretion system protein VirB11
MANENDQPLNAAQPILSGDLLDGSRVELIIPPVAAHYTLSLRRHRPTIKRLSEYQRDQYFEQVFLASEKHECPVEKKLKGLYQDKHWYEFLSEAVKAKKNIVVSGGTDTGKTTLLNALLSEIPLDERIITLENARELKFNHENVVRLSTRSGGKLRIDMEALIKTCLRLNPDRIMVGEIRGKEVLQFIAACATGHEGSMTSIHANNPRLAIMRMKQFYQQSQEAASMRDEQILAEIDNVVDIIVQAGFDKYQRRWFASEIYYKAIGWRKHDI